ncbi:MAG: hypothetical protein QXD23_02585 [Candidatus Micrarchaeaceae archaeon]
MATGKGIENWKAKKWLNIYTPELFGKNTIGEMPINDEKNAPGRMIKVSMSWITNNPMHSFMVVGLKIDNVNGNAAHTQLKYIEQTFSYLHSLVKRHGSAIYTIDNLKDKNNSNIVIKLIATTNTRLTTKKRMAIRKELSNFLKEQVQNTDKESIIKGMVEGTVQKEAMKKVNNIVALNRLEIKRLEL